MILAKARIGLGLCAFVLAVIGCSPTKERELVEQSEKARVEASTALKSAAAAREEVAKLNGQIKELEASRAVQERTAVETAAVFATVVDERNAARRALEELRETHGKLLTLYTDAAKSAAEAEAKLAGLNAENQRLMSLIAESTRSTPRPAAPNAAPDERTTAEQLGQLAASQSKGVVTLLGFEKTDGKRGARDGVETYTMEYTAEVRFGATCRWLGMGFGPGELEFKVAVPPARMNAMDELLFYSTNPGPTMQRGDRVRIKGEMHFDRSERGWRLRRAWQTSMEKA
jgi:hypothetical protein